jgi:hypothetical protein
MTRLPAIDLAAASAVVLIWGLNFVAVIELGGRK